MLFVRNVLVPAALVTCLLAPATALAADPTGVWMNDTGRGAIEIKPCGAGLCGHVVWVKDTSDAMGCGRQIIGNAAKTGANTWDNGWIYSPERKKNYDLELTALDANRLRIKGYAGTKLFSKTMIWTRAPADLVRCGQEQIAATKPAAPAMSKTATAKTAAAMPPAAPVAKPATNSKIAAAVAEPPLNVPPPVPATRPSREASEPAPTPEPERDQVASAEDEGDIGSSPLRERLGEIITKRDDGTCNLDLPWVKLDFPCEKKR